MTDQTLYDHVLKNTILRTGVGSKLYGLNLNDSDRDEMGVCLEPYGMAMGLDAPFEQLEWRDAAQRTGKHDAPGEPGDLDLKVYSLRKFLRLALSGNPAIMELFYVPVAQWVTGSAVGVSLQAIAPLVVCKRAGKAYLGYIQAQRMRFTGERGGRHGAWRETGEGYDTKYAMHMLRLGFQGIELLTTGKLTFPLPSEPREYLRGVRRGESSTQQILTRCGELEQQLKDLVEDSPLRAEPDVANINAWMLNAYWDWWQPLHHAPLDPREAAWM